MQTQSTENHRSPSRVMDQFVLRLPEGLRDRVKRAADASRRSMNAEMVLYIEQGLTQQPQPKGPQL